MKKKKKNEKFKKSTTYYLPLSFVKRKNYKIQQDVLTTS